MGKRGSKIATYIDNDYKKEKEWKEKAKRMKKLKEKKTDIIILAEHSREPLIIEKEENN